MGMDPKPPPPADDRHGFQISDELRTLLALWDSKTKRGEEVTIAELCPDDADLAEQLRQCIWAAHASERGHTSSLVPPGPSSVGGYQILSELGRGGSSIVYLAEQPSPARKVALKLLNGVMASPQMVSKFRLETQMLAMVNHPGIAQIYDAGTAQIESAERAYFTMELVRGTSVSRFVHRKQADGDWSPRETVQLCLGYCDALTHAHEHRIIHRDIKPTNLLVTDEGDTKVIDFGIARLQSDDQNDAPESAASRLLVGTRPYMSPEQFGDDVGAIDGRTDVYCLAVVLYQLLVDRMPYDVRDKSLWDTAAVVRKVPPASLGSIDRRLRGDLDVILETALAKDPADRYQSMREFADDLKRFVSGHPIHARRQTATRQLWKWSCRHPTVATISAIAIAALMLLTFLATSSARIASTKQLELSESNRKLKLAQSKILKKVSQLETSEAETEAANRELVRTSERQRRTAYNATLMQLYELAAGQPEYVRSKLQDPVTCPVDLRGAAWHLVEHRTKQQTHRFAADPVSLLDLAIADDGDWLATSGSQGLRIWDLVHSECIGSVEQKLWSPQAKMAIDSVSRRVLYCLPDGNVERFDIDSGTRTTLPKSGPAPPRSVAAVAGTEAFLIGDDAGRLEYWESPDGQLQWSRKLANSPLITITMAEDGQRVGVLTMKGESFICGLNDGASVTEQKLPFDKIIRGRYSPELDLLACSKWSDDAIVWNLKEKKNVRSWQHRGYLPDVDFVSRRHADRASVQRDASAFVVTGRRRLETWSAIGRESSHYSANSGGKTRTQAVKQLASDVRTEKRAIYQFDPIVVDATADGRSIACGLRGGEVMVVRSGPPPPMRLWDTEHSSVHRMRYSESSRWLAASSNSIVILNAETGEAIGNLDQDDGIRQILFSADNDRLFSLSTQRQLACWQLPDGPFLYDTKLPPGVRNVHLAGDRIAVGLIAGSPLWLSLNDSDAADRRVADDDWTDFEPFLHVATSKDSPRVVACTKTALVVLAKGTESVVAKHPFTTLASERIALSPDGKTLVFGADDGRIDVWSLPELKLTETSHANAMKVGGLDFSNDGSLLVSAHFDGKILFWDTQTWEQQLAIDSGLDLVRTIRLRPSGGQLVAGGNRDEIVVYDWDEKDPVPSPAL